MILTRIIGPTEKVMTLEEAKLHLRVDHDDQDTEIEALIERATQRYDGRDGTLGRCLMPQTWRVDLPRFNRLAVALPLPPTIEVVSVQYLDPSIMVQTLDPGEYRIVFGGWQGALLLPVTRWPAVAAAPDAVRITFRAGYVSEGSPPVLTVPEPIRQAMLLLIRSRYDDLPNAGEAEVRAADKLVAPYRVQPVA